MLGVLGSHRRLCDQLTRRETLRIGGLSALGLGLTDFLRLTANGAERSTAPRPHFGQAKSCILLYLYGAASQLDTFDPKPLAPVECRGELTAIPTSVPGVQIGELLPHTARVIDRATIVRSTTHIYPLHAVAYSVTSNPAIDVPMQLNPKDNRHWPFIGSVVDYLEDRKAGGSIPKIPRNIGLPWQISSQRECSAGDNAGPYGAFLGRAYDPVWTEFTGEGTRKSTYTFGEQTITCFDPYGPIKSDGRFGLSSAANLPADMTLDRLDGRRRLVDQLNDVQRRLEKQATNRGFDRFADVAYSFLTSNELREAIDIHREPLSVRESYGMTLFGQASLAARRLVEAGSKFVSVFWDEFGLVNSAWDTHFYHYPLMREQLCPGLDRAFSTLLLDLESRGLLDETLVVCITEHGRTPKIRNEQGGGRDHWARAYSSVLAGGGIARGKVVGQTDRQAGEVIDTPVSPKDILATVYYLLGIDPEMMIADRLGRPLPLCGEGRVRSELFA